VDKPTTHVAINTDALAHNAARVLGALREGVRLMAVVKCNAYGHGLVRAARAFVDVGAQWLGVSSVAEGVELREAGISEPTLVFMPAAREECEALVAADLTATVTQTIHMAWLHDGAVACGRDASAHIYLDTGLGRMPSDDSAPQLLEMAAGLGDVRVTGVYTHYGPPGSGAIGDWMELFRSGVTVKMFRRLAEELRASEGRGENEPQTTRRAEIEEFANDERNDRQRENRAKAATAFDDKKEDIAVCELSTRSDDFDPKEFQ